MRPCFLGICFRTRLIVVFAAGLAAPGRCLADPAEPSPTDKPVANPPTATAPADQPREKSPPAIVPADKPAERKPTDEKPAEHRPKTEKSAADKPKSSAHIGVALIDVGEIYEHHLWFKQQMQEMKFDVQDAEADLKRESQQLKDMAAAAKGLGAEDLRALEREFATKQAALNVKAALQKADFLKREANIYLKIYEEVQEASASYCHEHDIHLLMRFSKKLHNDASKTPLTREEILAQINRSIVYSDVPEITAEVLEILNAREHPDPPAKPKKSDSSDDKSAE